MKASLSTLNPNAKSYVPIAVREASIESRDTVSAEHGTEKLTVTGDSTLKGQNDTKPQSTASYSNQVANIKYADEECEMDLAYLQMSFPGISEQSLFDVYTFNDSDLEASLEMLSLLESVETPDTLPDALDIGDVPGSFPCGECSTTKTKNVGGETCSYSGTSGTSDLAVAS